MFDVLTSRQLLQEEIACCCRLRAVRLLSPGRSTLSFLSPGNGISESEASRFGSLIFVRERDADQVAYVEPRVDAPRVDLSLVSWQSIRFRARKTSYSSGNGLSRGISESISYKLSRGTRDSTPAELMSVGHALSRLNERLLRLDGCPEIA